MRARFRYRLMKIALSLILLGPSSVWSSKRIRKDNDPAARRFRVRNFSMSLLEINWINIATEERVLQFELALGASDTLNSHIGHEFEIREKPNKNGECKGKRGICRRRFFQISDDEDQVFTVDAEFKIDISNSRTRAKEKAKATVKECRNFEKLMEDGSTATPIEQLDQLAACMKENIQISIAKQQDEIEFQASTRRRMGARLRDYACSDPKFPTTMSLAVQEWNPNNGRLLMDQDNHTVNVLLKTDTTMIATIENLAREEDCQYVQGNAVLTDEGPPPVVPWEARKDSGALSFLSRIYAYVDPAVKMMNSYARLPQTGEALFKLYEDSSEIPHPPHLHPNGEWPVDGPLFGRLLIFCEVPEEGGGGAIHFPESGVHVHPQLGEGLLVTYSKPQANEGFLETLTNEHFDCPVLAGRRTIVQHQFRLYHHE